jgi:hypothetical protein
VLPAQIKQNQGRGHGQTERSLNFSTNGNWRTSGLSPRFPARRHSPEGLERNIRSR